VQLCEISLFCGNDRLFQSCVELTYCATTPFFVAAAVSRFRHAYLDISAATAIGSNALFYLAASLSFLFLQVFRSAVAFPDI
jgi:hypothetical protein